LQSVYAVVNTPQKKKSIVANEYTGEEQLEKHIQVDSILATIDYKMNGCFTREECNLSIIKSQKNIVALLKSNERNYFSTLDKYKLNIFNTFIDELKNREFDQGCTTTKHYSVTIGNEKFEAIDGGCEWDGFSNLRKILFGKNIFASNMASF
jgi:hypothetical protein